MCRRFLFLLRRGARSFGISPPKKIRFENRDKKVYKDKKGGLKKSVFSRVKFCLYYAKPRSEGASINFSNALMTRDGASGLSCNRVIALGRESLCL